MKELHWLPVSQRIMFKVATITFKVLNSSEPKYLCELLNRYEPVRSLRSCDHNLLTVPRCRTVIASRAFSVAAPSLWNSLPTNIKNSGSIANFKKNLKTHLFNLAYDCISWSCDIDPCLWFRRYWPKVGTINKLFLIIKIIIIIFRQEAILSGFSEPMQIREYISHYQNAEVEN